MPAHKLKKKRNADIKANFDEKMKALKDSGLMPSTMVDVVLTEMSGQYYLAKKTLRDIIFDRRKPTPLKQNNAVEKTA